MPNPLKTYLRLYRESISGLPRATWMLAFVGLVNRAGTMVVPFLTLYFKAALGFSAGQAGALFAVWGVGALLGAYIGGWMSDHFGPVRVQVATLVGCGLGFYWLSSCETWVSLSVALFTTGAVFSAFRPANATTLVATCPPLLRGQAVALHRLSINLGMAIGPASGGFLAEIDYGLLFAVDGTVCILSGIMLAVLLGGVDVGTDHEEPDSSTKGSPWRDKLFLGVLLVTLLNSLIMFQWFATGPVFFKEVYRMREYEIGLVLGLNPVLIVIFEMIVIRRLRGYAPLPWIALGSLMLGVGTFLLPMGSGFIWCVIAVTVWTFGEMLESPLIGAFTANRAGKQHRGRYLGALNIAFAISAILAPMCGLQLYEHVGSTAMWIGTGVLGVCGALLAWTMSRRVRR